MKKKLDTMTQEEKQAFAEQLKASGGSDIIHSRWCLSIESNAYFNMGMEKIHTATEILASLK